MFLVCQHLHVADSGPECQASCRVMASLNTLAYNLQHALQDSWPPLATREMQGKGRGISPVPGSSTPACIR